MIKNFEDFVSSQNTETIEEGILSKLFKKDTLKNRNYDEFNKYAEMLREIIKLSDTIIEISKSIHGFVSGLDNAGIFIILESDFIEVPFTTNNLNVYDIVKLAEENDKAIKDCVTGVLKKAILSNDFYKGDKVIKSEKFRIGISFTDKDGSDASKKMYRHIKDKSEEKNPIFEIENVKKARCYTDILHNDEFEEGKAEIIWFNDLKKVKKFFE